MIVDVYVSIAVVVYSGVDAAFVAGVVFVVGIVFVAGVLLF